MKALLASLILAHGAPESPAPRPAATEMSPRRAEGPPPRVAPENYRMVLLGDVLVGVGGGAMIPMLVGLIVLDDARQGSSGSPAFVAEQERRRKLGLGLAIGGGATAAVAFAAGISMIVVGRKRERRRRERLNSSLRPALSPWFGAGRAGFDFALRF